MAILSFPALDTDNVLAYSLLGHELGHHIDMSRVSRLSTGIAQKVAISLESVEREMPSGVGPEDVEAKWQELMETVGVAIREMLADLLATRMVGLAFFLAQSEFLKAVTADWPGPTVILESGYPGIAWRLKLILEELMLREDGWDTASFLRRESKSGRGAASTARVLNRYLDTWRKTVARVKWEPLVGADRLTVQAVTQAVPLVQAAAREAVPSERKARLRPSFFERVRYLENELPPLTSPAMPTDFPEILSAACTYQLVFGAKREGAATKVEEAYTEHRKTSRLVLKAIELLAAKEEPAPAAKGRNTRRGGAPAVLSGDEILWRMSLPVNDWRCLAVLPRSSRLVQGASLDVRLGNWFAVARRVRVSEVDLEDHKARTFLLRGPGREEVHVPLGDRFVIHPGDFVLGTTLEFVALPHDVMAYVEGKSMVGRTGLLVATATTVAPTSVA